MADKAPGGGEEIREEEEECQVCQAVMFYQKLVVFIQYFIIITIKEIKTMLGIPQTHEIGGQSFFYAHILFIA